MNALQPYLAFRHRFRNLYLFDLEKELVRALGANAAQSFEVVQRELHAFTETLEAMADTLDE